jgi:SAM-dependent methyltransferase
MDRRIRSEVLRTWDEVLDHEYAVIEDVYKCVGHPCRLVEIGCGSRGFLGRRDGRLSELERQSVGIDIDRESLAGNRQVAYRVCGSCYSLPVKASTVDMVVCRWLFEHLERPEEALRELARVLRPGGFLYVKTPNLMNYAMLASWLTPVTFHNRFRAALGAHENIPTFYRANTRRRLKELAARTGFAIRRLESLPYSYMYYAFNKELFLAMRGVSRLIGKITQKLQLTIICVLEKVQDP